MEKLPRYQELIEPMLVFLKAHNGPATNIEINDAVARLLDIPSGLLAEIHSGNRTEFQYRMAWARTKAKSDGKIISSKRETWQVN
jgi:restriction endonuclease Mrr